MTSPSPEPLSVDRAKNLTENIRAAVDRVWELLTEAYEARVWEVLGYSSWEAYVREEFALSRSQSYRLLHQGRVIRELSKAAGAPVTVTGRQAEAIGPRTDEVAERVQKATRGRPAAERQETAQKAVETASEPVPRGTGDDGEQPEGADRNEPAIIVELRATIGRLMIERDGLLAENERLRARVAELEGVKPAVNTRCKHPVNRRIGNYCGACGTSVGAKG